MHFLLYVVNELNRIPVNIDSPIIENLKEVIVNQAKVELKGFRLLAVGLMMQFLVVLVGSLVPYKSQCIVPGRAGLCATSSNFFEVSTNIKAERL